MKNLYHLINYFDIKIYTFNNKLLDLRIKYDNIETKTIKNNLICVNINCVRPNNVYKYSAGILYFYYPHKLTNYNKYFSISVAVNILIWIILYLEQIF